MRFRHFIFSINSLLMESWEQLFQLFICQRSRVLIATPTIWLMFTAVSPLESKPPTPLVDIQLLTAVVDFRGTGQPDNHNGEASRNQPLSRPNRSRLVEYMGQV
ncbi:MAG: hypothetical protein F6K30_21615 [Cyanothece sp. SIO2G6]|nr:hypothetical protein [Cyanothece sp. SIO2G6]